MRYTNMGNVSTVYDIFTVLIGIMLWGLHIHRDTVYIYASYNETSMKQYGCLTTFLPQRSDRTCWF